MRCIIGEDGCMRSEIRVCCSLCNSSDMSCCVVKWVVGNNNVLICVFVCVGFGLFEDLLINSVVVFFEIFFC